MALVACSAVAVAAAGGGAAATGLAAVALISPLQWGLLLLSVLLSGYLGSRCLFEAQRTMHASSAQPFLAPQPLFAALWAPPPLFGSSTPALCEEPVSTLGAPPPRRGHRPLPRRRRRPDGERCRHRLHRHRRRRLLHRRACHASRRGCSRFTGHARRRCSRMPKRELRRASAEACDAGGGGGGGVGAAGGGVVSGGGGGGGVASGVGVALIWAGQRVSSSWLAAAPRARLYHSRLFAHGNTSRVPCERRPAGEIDSSVLR